MKEILRICEIRAKATLRGEVRKLFQMENTPLITMGLKDLPNEFLGISGTKLTLKTWRVMPIPHSLVENHRFIVDFG
jgi:hypothetical protein